jgi:hypothetical protein
MKKTFIFLLLCLLVVGIEALDACTIVMASKGAVVLVGNNYD